MRKRMLSLALAICLLSGLLAITASAAGAPVQLATPSGLEWHRFYLHGGENEGQFLTHRGMMSWREVPGQPEHRTEIAVYKVGESEPYYSSYWNIRGVMEAFTDWDFYVGCIEELEAGDYYYTIQPQGDGVTCTDGELVTSPVWSYTPPAEQLPAPEGLTWNWPNAAWTPAADDGRTCGYVVDFYYSPTSANASSVNELKYIYGFMWLFDEGEKGLEDAWETLYEKARQEEGYYYFRVRSFSGDAEQWKHSEFSDLSPAYQNGNPVSEPGQTPAPTPVPTPALTATPTASTVLVNGAAVPFDAYNIGGSNYFKLRDLASVLNGTAKQFEVSWDAGANAISLISGQPYTAVGGEMTPGTGTVQTPVPTSSKILLNGTEIALEAYNIGGNNYFKLRDIGSAFNFGVDWDGAANTVIIDTSKKYTA